MTGDINAALLAADNLRQVKIDHLRATIQLCREADPVYVALAADRDAALVAVEQEIAHATHSVQDGMRALGFGHLLAAKDVFGVPVLNGFVSQSEQIAPLHAKRIELKLDSTASFVRQSIKRELEASMKELRAEFDCARPTGT